MKNLLLIIFISLLFTNCTRNSSIKKENVTLVSQIKNTSIKTDPNKKLISKVKINGLYAYIDPKGNYIIKPKFKKCSNFSEGLAAVRIDKKWGYINTNGNLVIKPKFEFAEAFSEGLAKVKLNNKIGYINSKGAFLIDNIYNKGGNFKNNLTYVKINNKYGFINKSGTLIIEAKYDLVWNFNEGLCPVRIGKKWGYINTKGNLVIKPKFDYAKVFSEGLAAVKKHDKWGYINTEGIFKIKPILSKAEPFSEGLAFISLPSKFIAFKDTYGYIDKNFLFKFISSVEGNDRFYIQSHFSEGLATVKVEDYYYILNTNLEIVKQTSYDKIKSFKNGFAPFKENRKWGFLDKNGDVVIPPIFNEVSYFYDI